MESQYYDFMGSRVRVCWCEIGEGVIGVPVGPGPRIQIRMKEHGRVTNVVSDTLLIRDVACEGDVDRVEVVALLIGKNCVGNIKQIVAMGEEKRRALGCATVRVSRVKEGWQVAGWVALSQQEIGVA